MIDNMGREHVFDIFSETLSFLHKSINDFFYILDFQTGKLRFFGDIAEQYALPLDEDNCCTADD